MNLHKDDMQLITEISNYYKKDSMHHIARSFAKNEVPDDPFPQVDNSGKWVMVER